MVDVNEYPDHPANADNPKCGMIPHQPFKSSDHNSGILYPKIHPFNTKVIKPATINIAIQDTCLPMLRVNM